MEKLPIELIRQIYEYGSTYKIKFGKVLKQMMAHFLYTGVVSVLKSGTTVIATAQIAKHIFAFVSKYIIPKRVPMKMI